MGDRKAILTLAFCVCLTDLRRMQSIHMRKPELLLKFMKLRALGYLLLTGLIIGSFLPSKQKQTIGSQPLPTQPRTNAILQHRLYHLGAFGVTTMVFLLASKTIAQEMKEAARMVAIGCAIELLQCIMAKAHTMEWWDVRDDVLAVLASILLVQIRRFYRNSLNSNLIKD